MKWWSRWVLPPYELACRASALLVCHDPVKIGKPPWCCPRHAEFWRLCCTSWCATYWNSECTEVRKEGASIEIGAAARSCTRTSSVAGRHSPLKSQPRKLRSPGASSRSGALPFQQRTNTSCYLAIPTHGFTVALSVFGAHLLPSP